MSGVAIPEYRRSEQSAPTSAHRRIVIIMLHDQRVLLHVLGAFFSFPPPGQDRRTGTVSETSSRGQRISRYSLLLLLVKPCSLVQGIYGRDYDGLIINILLQAGSDL